MAKELKNISSYRKPLWQYILSPKRGLFIAISAVIFTVFMMLNIDLKVSAATGINRTINFQGKVVNSNGTNVADGQYTFVFKLHDAPSGGANPWTETQNNVQVTGGVFRVSLGSVTTFASAGVDFNTDNLYLGINFNADGEMDPRIRFAAVPYAINAQRVAGLTVTDTTGTLTIANSKTFSVSNTLGFTGTDGTTFALPDASGTIVTLDASQILVNKTIGSSGLTFSGASTDITTGTNESLTIAANGTGNLLVQSGSGGQSALIVDKTGDGDIFTASSSGVPRFTIKSDGTASSSAGFTVNGVGSLQSTDNQTLTVGGGSTGDLVIGRTSQRVYLPGFDTCTALETSGGILSCGSDSTGGGDNFWQYNTSTGIVANGNLTTDFLLGATSTQSAKFAVLNIAGTQTPVASISAQNASAQALVLGGDGAIQSVRNNSLTLGGDTTGNIFLRPQNNAGLVTIVHAAIGTGGLKLTSSEADSVNKEGRIKIGHYLSSEEPVTLIFGQSLNTQNNIFIGGNSGSENAATEINFLTALNNTTVTGTRRMRINQYGDVSIGIQGVDPDARLHVKGGTTGGNASMIVDQIGDSANDIFAASASGTTKFVIKNDGTASSSAGFTVDGVGSLQSTNNQTLTLGGGSTGDLVIGRTSQRVYLPGFDTCTALETSGGILSCGSDASGLSSYNNFWQYDSATGIVANGNLTTDFLLGATSTQSAKFAVIGIAGTDTPVASVSAIGGTNDTKGIYLSGDGSLQSVRNNTLTLGGNTTGDMSFKPGNVSTPALYLSSSGNVGIGTTAPTSALDVVGSLLLGANSTIDTRASGSLSIGTAANTSSLALGRSGNTTTFNSTSWTATPTISGLITATSGVSIATGQSYTGAGTVTLSSASDNDLTLTAAGSGNLIITSDANTGVRIGSNAVASALFVEGGIGGNAGFILNRVGSTDDILAASASGVTKFVIKNDGTASSSAGFVVDGVGSVQSTNNQTLTVGGGSTGDLIIGRTSQVVTLPGFDCSALGNGGKLTTTTGGVLACAADISGAGGGANFWQYDSTTGIIAPGNLTADILFGGTSTASAGFRIAGATKDYGTVAAASVSANTSFAGLVIDNKGVGDLFTASSSGVTQLVLTNNGALGIGTNAPTAKLDVYGSASISGLLAFRTGAGQIQTTANNSLTIGGGTTGNVIFPNAGGIFLGQNELVNGLITLFSSGVGETDPSIYADASGNLILSAPTGTVQMGNGSGNISMSLTNAADLFAADKTVTLASNYSGTDFSFSRVLTGGANSQGGAIFSITDTSGGSGTINPDMLLVNAALTSGNFQGTLGRFQQSGVDKLRIYGNGTSPVATISADTSFAGLVVDQNGLGDIFTASTGGVTKFTVMNSGELYTSNYRNNGGILYTNTNGILGQTTVGSNNECLKSIGGGTPTWGTCGGGGNFWQYDTSTGIVANGNLTTDLLLGGTSTQSAKFAVIGIAGTDTPVASVSATSGSNIDKGISISGDGSLQSVRMNNLTLGGSTTGDIYLRPGNSLGIVKIIHQDDSSSGLLVTSSETQSIDKSGRIKFGSYDITDGYVTGMLASSEVAANQLFIGGGSATENSATVIRFRTAQNVGTLAGTERMRIDNYGWVGVGEIGDANTALQSQLYVTGGSQGANAAAIINQTGISANDILAASASGVTKFTIKNDGTASSSAGFVVDGVGSLQSTNNQTLTVGGGSTGDLIIGRTSQVVTLPGFDCSGYGNSGKLTTTTGGVLTCAADISGGGAGSSNWTLSSVGTLFANNNTLDILLGGNSSSSAAFRVTGQDNPFAGTLSAASVSANTSFAGLVVDQNGLGDIFTASKSGAKKFTIENSGNVLIGTGSATEKLTMNGGNFLQKADGDLASKGTYNTPSNAQDIHVSGKYAYIADGTTLQIIDISKPTEPFIVGTNSSFTAALSVYVAGKYAYVVDTTAAVGLKVLDISNPLAPQVIGSYAGSGNGMDVFVSGNKAYYLDSTDGLTILDISIPENPVRLYKDVSIVQFGESVYVQGKYAYVGDFNNILYIFDISNPSSAYLVKQQNVTNTVRGIYISGNYAYLAQNTLGLMVVDIANPNAPTIVGSVDTVGNATKVFVSGKYAYVAGGTAGLQVIDISNPTAPKYIGAYDSTNALDTFVSGKYAYVADGTAGLQVVDINGIDSPAASIGNIATNSLQVSENTDVGNNLYIGGGVTIGLGGILANGTFSFVTASGSGNLIQGAPTGKSLLILNQTGSQDIFTASASGVAKFAITNAGGIRLGTNEGNSGECFKSAGVGSGATWGACGGAAVWDQTLGSIVPANTTLDFLAGGTSTASAAFKVTGQGNPFKGTLAAASVSADTSFAGLVVDNKGTGDIFTASSAGLTRFTVRQNGLVQVGAGEGGSTVPGVLGLGVKSDSGDPTGGAEGQMYYNTNINKFRCYQDTNWTDCIAAGASPMSVLAESTLGSAANNITLTVAAREFMNCYLTTKGNTATAITWLRFNSDAGANYDYQLNYNIATAYVESQGLAQNQIVFDTTDVEGGHYQVQIGNFSDANKSVWLRGNRTDQTTGPDNFFGSGSWRNTAAQITTVAFLTSTSTFLTGAHAWCEGRDVADYAENYYSKDLHIEAGDVVTHDPTLPAGIKKASRPYDPQLIGSISTKPGIVLDEGIGFGKGWQYPVALSGRIPVKVNTQNGPIRPGDLLTSSSQPGVAMKATKAGAVIGQAMAGFDGEGVGKVLTFVKTVYYNGSGSMDLISSDTDNMNSDLSTNQNLKILNHVVNNKAQYVDGDVLSEIITDRVVAGLEVIAPNIVTQDVALESISAYEGKDIALNLSSNGLFIIKDESEKDLFTIDASGSAFFKGTITADKIVANQIEGLEIITNSVSAISDKINNSGSYFADTLLFLEKNQKDLSAQMTSLSEKLEKIGAINLLGFVSDASGAGELTMVNNFAAYGNTTLSEVSVLNSLTIGSGSTMMLGNSSIDTVGTDLAIQSLKQGAISFLGGLITFASDGKAVFVEDVAFEKNAAVKGVLSAQSVSATNLLLSQGKTIVISDTEVEATSAAGLVTLIKEKDHVQVNNPLIKENSYIFITPKTKTSRTLFLLDQVENTPTEQGYFVVGIDREAVEDIKFNYLIVN